MKLITAGGRDFNDYGLLKRELDKLKDNITEVVSGGARGADALGERWAGKMGKTLKFSRPNGTSTAKGQDT